MAKRLNPWGNIKYFVVQIDPSLNWKEQLINVAIGKILQGIRMLQTIQMMYFSIVDPQFRYCCSVWVCAGDTIQRKLQGYKIGQLSVLQRTVFCNVQNHEDCSGRN